MKRYATIKLWPAISVLVKLPDPGQAVNFELTEDGAAPAELGGHVVGWRDVSMDRGETIRTEGIFHMVHRDDGWKVEDMYWTTVNDRPLANPLVLSRDYNKLVEAQKRSTPPEKKDRRNDADVIRGLASLLRSKGFWKVFAVVLLGIGAGATALGKKIKEQTRAA